MKLIAARPKGGVTNNDEGIALVRHPPVERL
jgi:hypothetical protein